jgi:peptide/nickel transport system permease protein
MSGAEARSGGADRAPTFRTMIGTAGIAGLGLIAVIVTLNNVIAHAPAGAVNIALPLLPPGAGFGLGTDAFGRDIMSEMVHALAVSFAGAALAAAIAVFIGAFVGFAAVRMPLRMGLSLRAISGTVRTIPALFLAVVFIALSSRNFATIAVGLAICPAFFNRSFDSAMSLTQSRHAMYARASGIPSLTLLRRDLVYELRSNFVHMAGRALASSATLLATLSFLGFGAIPPHRDLGLMIADGHANYLNAWWCVFFPALMLILFVLFARLAAADDGGEAL